VIDPRANAKHNVSRWAFFLLDRLDLMAESNQSHQLQLVDRSYSARKSVAGASRIPPTQLVDCSYPTYAKRKPKQALDEIRALLPRSEAGLAECRRVRDLLSAKLGEFDTRLAELRAFRRRLARYLRECEETLAGNRGDCCPVLFEITHAGDRKSKPRVALARRGRKDKPYKVRRCA
jgi:MerR, DNA binding